VVNLHVAPGLGNAMGSLYNAAMGKMPLVVTAGQQDSRMLAQEPLLSYDLVAMAAPLTKWAVQIQHAKDIPLILSRAFKVAQDPPRGPVFVALPGDVLDDEAIMQIPEPGVFRRDSRPAPGAVETAVDLLVNAVNPAIICGDGVSAVNAQNALVRLSETLGAPVWNTLMMGALNFPTSHPHFRGLLPGEAPVTRQMLGDTDVILAVGARLFDAIFHAEGSPLPDGCRLVQLDNASWEIAKNIPVDMGILADPGQGLDLLEKRAAAIMGPDLRHAAKKRCVKMADEKIAMDKVMAKDSQKRWDNIPISPARLMSDLKDCLPENAVIYNEAITAYIDLISSIPFDRPGSLFGNHGGGIGQGLPGALGVKLAKPDQPVIALVGDGSAMYTIQSLWTAAYHDIPVVYIILSNRGYRILKYNMNRYVTLQDIKSETPYAYMNFDNPPLDFVGLARGMGVAGKCITKPDDIKPAIKEALAKNRPYVLEVVTEGKGPGE
jgi:benzoylformate decarboxylase